MSDDFIWNYVDSSPLELSITYLDDLDDFRGSSGDSLIARDTGHFRVEYDAWNMPCQTTSSVPLCGDGQEKTVTFHLRNARFGNSQELGSDLRLARSPGTALCLRGLQLRKGSRG